MDDDDETAADRRRQGKEGRRAPEHTYKETLQKLADRSVDEIIIDLDDLSTVGRDVTGFAGSRLT